MPAAVARGRTRCFDRALAHVVRRPPRRAAPGRPRSAGVGAAGGQRDRAGAGRARRRLAEPLGAELEPSPGLIDHGTPVGAALGTWSASTGASADVRMVAAALTLGAGAGGEVARAVDGVAATLRERHELQAEVRALATQARASAAVLAPLLFAGLVATLEPHAITFLVTTPAGLACLTSGSAEGLGCGGWLASPGARDRVVLGGIAALVAGTRVASGAVPPSCAPHPLRHAHRRIAAMCVVLVLAIAPPPPLGGWPAGAAARRRQPSPTPARSDMHSPTSSTSSA